MTRGLLRLLLFLLAAGPIAGAFAQEGAQRLVHLLDYIAADYAGAVHGGAVGSDDEYREMVEFAAQASKTVEQLHAPAAIASETAKLAGLIAAMADAPAVAQQASRLRWMVIDHYRLQISPRAAPAPGTAEPLYAAWCASCHGREGRGDGAAGLKLDPRPADFHAAAMAERSLYSIYNALSLGIPGTAMPAFNRLSEEQRWALSFYVARLGIPGERVREGEAIWRSADHPVHKIFTNLRAVTALSRNEIAGRDGEAAALAFDYLRARPGELEARRSDPIVVARALLEQSLAAYENNQRDRARELALAAYLDGFELAEARLDVANGDLRMAIEREMLSLRAAIGAGEPAGAVRGRADRLDAMLARAAKELSGQGMSRAGTFLSACVILVREGLEAILLLAAIMAFVAKTGRREAMPWIHAGWVLALAGGLLTWLAAQYVFDISGADRETTEGLTALVAAATLVYVGFWLHGKSHSLAWQKFLREKVGTALEERTLWAMAGVSFLAVYRELFELILFYEALWAQSHTVAGGPAAILSGVAVALVLLGLAAWAMFHYGVRLPLGPMFTAMLWLVLGFAIVFAGDGVAKLQEAGVVSASPIRFPALPVLGVHPTLETLSAQLAVIAIVTAGFWVLRRKARLSDAGGRRAAS